MGFHQGVSSLLLYLDQPGPAHSLELARFLSFQEEHLGPYPFPPSIPPSHRYVWGHPWGLASRPGEHTSEEMIPESLLSV